jgi:hypothetical protein
MITLRRINTQPQTKIKCLLPHTIKIKNRPLTCSVSCKSRIAYAYGDKDDNYIAMQKRLEAILSPSPMNGRELRNLLLKKWGKSYDIKLTKLNERVYLQIMWKYLEQRSFPLTEQEYIDHLDAIAEHLNHWNVNEKVRDSINRNRSGGPGYISGGNTRCVFIYLGVDL